MKFTKENAIKGLEAKLQGKAKGLDLSRTINEHVSNMLELVGDDENLELEKFVSAVEKTIYTSLGLVHSEVSSASKIRDAQIEELKKKIQQQNAPAEPPAPKEPENQELKTILERLKTLENERSEETKKMKISEKRNALVEKIKEDGVKNADWVSDIVSNVSVTEDTDVEAESKKYVEMYNKYFSKTPANISPEGTHTDESSEKNPVLDRVRELQKQRASNGLDQKQEEKIN